MVSSRRSRSLGERQLLNCRNNNNTDQTMRGNRDRVYSEKHSPRAVLRTEIKRKSRGLTEWCDRFLHRRTDKHFPFSSVAVTSSVFSNPYYSQFPVFTAACHPHCGAPTLLKQRVSPPPSTRGHTGLLPRIITEYWSGRNSPKRVRQKQKEKKEPPENPVDQTLTGWLSYHIWLNHKRRFAPAAPRASGIRLWPGRCKINSNNQE